MEEPFSAGKMAVALAISLVDRAYCLGAVTDCRRQTLLQELEINRIYLDRASGRLIEASFASEYFLFIDQCYFRDVCRDIWRFRTAVDEIEDAVDQIDYRMLEEEVDTSISKFVKRKLFNKVTRLGVRNLKRLTNALGSSELKLSTTTLRSLTESLYQYRNERYPSSVCKGGMFVRNREREQIVHWLTMETAEDSPFSVYALVGMAGMGKTTIANIVCQDSRVSADFKDAVVWVHVSVGFNTETMASIILEQITDSEKDWWMPSSY